MTLHQRRNGEAKNDIIIVGAGPAGLALSLSLRGSGLNILLVERQAESALREPAYDGREIALSLRSINILRELGAWDRLDGSKVSPLRAAKVIEGGGENSWQGALHFDPQAVGEDRLGSFVANSDIRWALYAEHAEKGEATLLTDTVVEDVYAGPRGGAVILQDGRTLEAPLIIAADSRFSKIRERVGAMASVHRFNKTMILAKVQFEKHHDHIAWECFLPGGAMAILPLNDNCASIVQSFDPAHAEAEMDLPLKDYVAKANARLSQRFGEATPLSERFAYPLVGVYAQDFVLPGFACVGDAAVGMHPMTAHGFNLGVQGQSILAQKIRGALKRGFGSAHHPALEAYQQEHRRLSAGFYWSTLALAELSGQDALPAKVTRRALVDAGRLLPAAREFIMKGLTQPLSPGR